MENIEECQDCKKLLKKLTKLQNELDAVNIEVTKMKILLDDNGLAEEDLNKISDTEAICTRQIEKLKELSEKAIFSANDAKVLDILHSNLIRARGGKLKDSKSKLAKSKSDDELLHLVKGE